MSNNPVAESLKKVLASSYILSLKTQNYHWNVKGPHFKQLHDLFGEQYNELNTAIDDIAERIRALGTILFFQITQIPWPVLAIMILAIINGLITSIILETIILIRQNFKFKDALKTALGMSFISMVSMEIAMNLTDYLLTGGAMLTWWVVPIMLTVGFLTPWPYNYWRLKKFGIACH